MMAVIFCVGYFAGIRGQSEHINISMAEFCEEELHTLQTGGQDLVGLKFCGPMVPFNKANPLKLGKTSLKPGQAAVRAITEDPTAGHEGFCPFSIIQFYLSKCHPEAKKFYAKASCTQKMTLDLKKDYPDKDI